uniref:Uncharacterized protein n=1 Tax=Arcella intermedia TaxID=1963864 RepID=A0A6B2LJ95_9EUKA
MVVEGGEVAEEAVVEGQRELLPVVLEAAVVLLGTTEGVAAEEGHDFAGGEPEAAPQDARELPEAAVRVAGVVGVEVGRGGRAVAAPGGVLEGEERAALALPAALVEAAPDERNVGGELPEVGAREVLGEVAVVGGVDRFEELGDGEEAGVVGGVEV